MAEVPAAEKILFSKIDLSFAHVLPDIEGAPLRIVDPQALQMGWTESPALFCSAAETARDVIQHFIDSITALPPHALEHHFVPSVPAPRQASPSDCPRKLSAVFVDDYMFGAVESSDGSMLA
jgi:hypothetical protein